MRLFQFHYSPFAAKVRKCLELKGLACEIAEVPYLDRRELIAVTGGSIHIPVLVDGERVIPDSAQITQHLDERYATSLRSGANEGPAVVLEQWADNVLEDVAFRWAAPAIQDRIAGWNGGSAEVRAFFTVIKERRYGAGCLDAWRRSEEELRTRVSELLAPLARTLTSRPYLLGDAPTVGDAAVWGQLHMIEVARPGRIAADLPELIAWYGRVAEARGP